MGKEECMKVKGDNEKFIKEVIKDGFITNTRFYECEDDNGYMEVKERGITYVLRFDVKFRDCIYNLMNTDNGMEEVRQYILKNWKSFVKELRIVSISTYR